MISKLLSLEVAHKHLFQGFSCLLMVGTQNLALNLNLILDNLSHDQNIR